MNQTDRLAEDVHTAMRERSGTQLGQSHRPTLYHMTMLGHLQAATLIVMAEHNDNPVFRATLGDTRATWDAYVSINQHELAYRVWLRGGAQDGPDGFRGVRAWGAELKSLVQRIEAHKNLNAAFLPEEMERAGVDANLNHGLSSFNQERFKLLRQFVEAATDHATTAGPALMWEPERQVRS